MARTPNMNRSIRILPPAKDGKATQFWAPLITAAGVAFDTARRGLVPDVIARLMEAHLASGPLATFGAVGHGLRAISNGTTGAGCPFFLEAKGVSSSVVLLMAVSDHNAARVALGSNITETKAVTKASGNLYVTLAPDADADAVYRFACAHAATRANVGYKDSMGAPADLDAVAFEAPTVEAAPVEAPATESKPSKRAAKRAAKAKGGEQPAVEAPQSDVA